MQTRSGLIGLSLAALLVGCAGSSTPPPSEPEAPAPVASEPAPPPDSEPAPEVEPEAPTAPAQPQQVHLDEAKVDGEGLDPAAVRSAFEVIRPGYEECFAKALESTPDAQGGMSVTLLYVAGERKSVSASYGGPGAAEINKCFQQVSTTIELSPAADSERVVVVLRMKLEPSS
jgi:hypothetical protein